MEIALFGGTFNPPTKAHQTIISECANLPFIDEVWVMPSGQRRDKQFETSNAHRVAMLEAVIGDLATSKMIRIDETEMHVEGQTNTADTHEILKMRYPEFRFWFVFGMDTYLDMPNWDGGKKLHDSLQMLIVPRDDRVIEPTDRVRWLPINKDSFTSSTEVRQRVASGMDIEELVCPAIAEYIHRTNLYRTSNVA